MEDGIEKEILRELSNRQVMNKEELIKIVEGKAENPALALDAVLKSLLEKGYVTNVSPLGSACYVVTTKGIREANL